MKNILFTLKNILTNIVTKQEVPQKTLQVYKKSEKIITKAAKEKKNAGPKKFEIDISWFMLFRLMLAAGLFWLAISIIAELQTIIVTFGVLLFFALALSPILNSMERYMPRVIAILLLYIVFFGGLTLLFVKMIPILAGQMYQIALNIRELVTPKMLEESRIVHSVLNTIGITPVEIQEMLAENLTTISRQLQSVAGSTFTVLFGIFNGLFSVMFALVLLFFILLEREKVGLFFLHLFPKRNREYMVLKAEIIQHKMAEWFEAQIILMASVGLGMFIGLLILKEIFGMPNIGILALFAGFMELFPYIGIILTGAICTLIAASISWGAVLGVIILIGIVQQLEGSILVPLVMEKVVGLSAIVTILSLAAGAILGNALGGVGLSIVFMILSVPVATAVSLFVKDYMQ